MGPPDAPRSCFVVGKKHRQSSHTLSAEYLTSATPLLRTDHIRATSQREHATAATAGGQHAPSTSTAAPALVVSVLALKAPDSAMSVDIFDDSRQWVLDAAIAPGDQDSELAASRSIRFTSASEYGGAR